MKNLARSLLLAGTLALSWGLATPTDAAAAWGDVSGSPIFSGWSSVLGFSPHLVGRDLNGTDLNGAPLDGRRVVSVRLDDGWVDGREVDWLEVSESRFTGRAVDGHPLHTRDLADAVLVADLDDGSPLPLYVTEVWRHPEKPLHDVFGYRVWFETQESFEPLCGFDDDGEAALAIALAGRWDFSEGTPTGGSHVDDPLAFTFACDGYVIAKCVLAGYKPWGRVRTCHKGEGCVVGDLAHWRRGRDGVNCDYLIDRVGHVSYGRIAVDRYHFTFVSHRGFLRINVILLQILLPAS